MITFTQCMGHAILRSSTVQPLARNTVSLAAAVSTEVNCTVLLLLSKGYLHMLTPLANTATAAAVTQDSTGKW
jgi:hypothetical protein